MSGIQQGLLASYPGAAVSTLLTGLVAYWKLDESSGNATDSKGTNTGVNTSVTYSTGKINNGGNFNSTSSYLLLNNFGLSTNLTYSAWINLTNNTKQYEAIIGHGGSTSANGVPAFRIDKDPNLRLRLIKSFVSVTAESNTIVMNNSTFYHVCVSYDGTNYVFYLDGTSVGSGTASTTFNTSNSMCIGADNTSGGQAQWFNGMIDEVGVWNRALTSTEITELYNSGTGKQYPF